MDQKGMETITGKTAIYPGCSLEGTAAGFEISLRKALGALDITLPHLRDWNCCGATSAHALDHRLYLALCLRNLALAEDQGFSEILAPCAACYHRLASAGFEFGKDNELLERLNVETGLEYGGSVTVRNILDYLANVVGTGRIAQAVKTDGRVSVLSGLKVACYYGCLNTRIPRMKGFDVMENPTCMDRIVRTLGAEALDWSYKTDCCGASLFISSESTASRLVSKILKDAVARGADCIAVACPMCHNNLDTIQNDIRRAYDIPRPMPVLFITQLMGLSFGMTASELKLNHAFVPFTQAESMST